MKTLRTRRNAAALLVALYGCVTLYGCASASSGSARSAASLSSVVAASSAGAVPSVPSLPFVLNATPDVSRVPAPQADIPRTGGPPRTDCSDATVTATGQLLHGRGTITLTSRPGAPVCDLGGGSPTHAQLVDDAGTKLVVRSVDPTAAITTDPPDYGWLQLGDGGPGSNQRTSVSFKVEWDGAYCGPAPTRLLLSDSSWVGNAGVPITVTLTNSSPPCGTPSAGAGDTIAVYPANGYPLAAPEWATLRAAIHSVSGTRVPSFVVRLTNPTGVAVPLRPCFSYGIGFVSKGLFSGQGGWAESVDGSPDCAKLPTSLAPHASLDLPIHPNVDQPAQDDPVDGTWTWLMPGGPRASFVFPPSN